MSQNDNLKTIGKYVTDEKVKEEALKKQMIERILKYLNSIESICNCKFSKEYAAEIEAVSSGKTSVPHEVIYAILDEWKIWEPYVTSESRERFICHEIKTHFKIDCCSTSSSKLLNSYIGNKAEVTKMICTLTTSVNEKGTLLKNGREVKK